MLAYPLWILATNFQNEYSLSVSFCALILFSVFLIKKIKKHGAKHSLRFFVKFLIVTLGIISSFTLVLYGKRLFALLTLVFMSTLYFLSAKFLKDEDKELKNEN